MRKATLVTALLLLASNTAWAQFTESGPLNSTGFSQARLSRIDSVINAEIAAGKIPGAVALVARNGQLAYFKSFGFADVDAQTSMQKDSIFRLASMTKAITSVGAMILYERGLFQLNDPVSKFIPAFADMAVVSEVDSIGNVTATVPATEQIKIIDLFTHSSGISYPFASNNLQKTYVDAGVIDGLTSKDITLAAQMELLAQQPLLFEPGSDYVYGLSLDLLGYLIEVVSGKSLEQFFNEEIFTPLSMRDSYFYLPESKFNRLATLYSEVDKDYLTVSQGRESNIILDNPNYPAGEQQSYFSGGAGVSATAYDYARFIQMLLNNGELEGSRILSRKSVELLQSPRIDSDGDQVPDFGLGFEIIVDPAKAGELGSIGSYSWSGAFLTSYWIDPSEDLIAVFMSQVRPSQSNIRAKFKTMVYQALE
ncbi:MAG: serine hydrolase [Gammaproteobacteria bacterium]|nr:serine hydrolase [Gammaproteobacteria bacterium]MDG2339378.1 serine hydrolase [Gammaproteobacteria bacterium]